MFMHNYGGIETQVNSVAGVLRNMGKQLPLFSGAGWFVRSTVTACRGLYHMCSHFKMADITVRFSGKPPVALSPCSSALSERRFIL